MRYSESSTKTPRHEDRPKFVPLDNVKWKSGMPSSEFYWRLWGAALLISSSLYSLGAEKANLITANDC